MKKAMIIFAVLFALTLAIPAAVIYSDVPDKETSELATLFAEPSEQN